MSAQALRQTLLKKYARIRTEMDNLHNKRMSPYEKIEALESIRCQIQASWRTDEIRRQKPTPQVRTAGWPPGRLINRDGGQELCINL